MELFRRFSAELAANFGTPCAGKIDTLLTDELARAAGVEGIARGFEDYAAIGGMLDGGLAGQQQLDLVSLEKAIGRTLSQAERDEISAVQIKAYRYTFLVSGVRHPNFVRACTELAPPAAEKIAEMAQALS